ncbi:hypothetical protein ACA910_016048 [Epithemia clementina (nom. ined.)]
MSKTTTTANHQKNKPGFQSIPGCTALVTGSSGLCGARLVEMLLERGAKHVICLDLMPPSPALQERFEAVQKATGGTLSICSGKDEGDLTSDAAVEAAFAKAGQTKIDCVYHIGALVGPFHDRNQYYAVNYYGTLRILEQCRKHQVPKLVYSSSPSTRFTGADVTGQTEDELPMPTKWLAMYAEAKAKGEVAVSQANDESKQFKSVLRTISVAPHQIYGPYDSLFLPNLLETAGNGRLRIFGNGRSIISICYVDNYAHGLMCGADALDDPNSPAAGQFYIVTDGEPQKFWDLINTAILAMGFVDLRTKRHLPVWLLYMVAYVANVVGVCIGKKFKLNPFNVRMLTMHRYFSIERAKRDLHYEPVVPFSEAWPLTVEWFKLNWLTKFLEKKRKGKLSSSQKKD